jgi:hypothetical protein
MASTLDQVLGDAMQLPPDERARLVTELLAALEPELPSDARSEAEWIAEIERRARAAMAGSPGRTWAEARAEIQRRRPSG